MKYYAFFSLVLLSSAFVLSHEKSSQPEYKLASEQEQDNLLNAANVSGQSDEFLDQSAIDVQLPCNEATQELTKAMKELWDTLQYEPDAIIKSLLDENAEYYSSLAMERALEISFNLLEEHGEGIPEKINLAFTRSLSKLVLLSGDFDCDFDCDFACDDNIRCSCADSGSDSSAEAYFNS